VELRGSILLAMAWELHASQAAVSVRTSGVVLDDSLRAYLAGVSLDLLASSLLVLATAGVKGRPFRLSLALALFVCLHLFGGWQREPKELAFSMTVLLWFLSLGAHAWSLAVSRERHRTALRSASWAHYWSGQIVSFGRQVAFEAVAVLSLLVLLTVEALIILDGSMA
jgi:hypothetical protein